MTAKYLPPAGSAWRKWDLHLHSPFTHLANRYDSVSVDDFIKKLSENEIAIVGLTNYFRFKDEDFEFADTLRSKGFVVFLNLELRTKPENKEDEDMHIHIIFSDSVSKKKINDFLGRLKTFGNKICSNLIQGEIETETLSFQILKDTLAEEGRLGNLLHIQDYILAACPRGQGEFRPLQNGDGRGNAAAIVIDKETDVLFGCEKDVAFFLREDRFDGCKKKPVFSCSDAHNLESVGSKSTWVKADTTFDGLLQAVFDPEERAKIQDRYPLAHRSDAAIIDHVTYTDNIQGATARTLSLNPVLNSIIGRRGSGKSQLLKHIAGAVDKKQYEVRDGSELYGFKDFSVVWKDGKNDGGDEDSSKGVFYIPQGYLSSLAYDGESKQKERDDFLISLLLKNKDFSFARQTHEAFVAEKTVQIQAYVQSLISTHTAVLAIEKEIRDLGTKTDAEGEIKKKKEEQGKYKGSTVNEKELEDYTSAQKLQQRASVALDVLARDERILQELANSGTIPKMQDWQLLSENRKSVISDGLKAGNDAYKIVLTIAIEEVQKEVAAQTTITQAQQAVISGLQPKIEANQALIAIADEIRKLEGVIAQIEDAEKRLGTEKDKYVTDLNAVVAAHAEYGTKISEIYQKVTKLGEQYKTLSIVFEFASRINELQEFVDEDIHTRNTDHPVFDQWSKKSPLAEPAHEEMKSMIDGLVLGKIALRKQSSDNLPGVLMHLLRNRYHVDFLKSVMTKDGLTNFGSMTGGQRAIALLELIFTHSNEKYPVLIDQPEDDLDVAGVANNLVEFLKEEKNERQVIVATHNANLVVCADSENVVCAKATLQGNQHIFSYQAGAIENELIRKNIIETLEGGRDALNKRMRKLAFRP